ncbi:caspase family protein [Labrys okinawensis]|nr:caspase family protein [Labrys okinawensis]
MKAIGARFAVILALLLVSAPLASPARAEADFSSAQRAAGQYSREEITALQSDLPWVDAFADLSTLPELGSFDSATFQAIRQFERKSGMADSGTITPALIAAVRSQADAFRKTVGFKEITERGVTLGYAASLMSVREDRASGPRFKSPAGDVVLDILTIPTSKESFDALFQRLRKSQGGKKVLYADTFGNPYMGTYQFVIYGKNGSQFFYIRFLQTRDGSRGFTLGWDDESAGPFFNVHASAMALSFRAAGDGTANAASADGVISTAEINRQLEICAKSKDAAEIVTACTTALSASTLLANNRPTVLYNRSVGYNRQNKADLALADIDQAIALDPDQASYYTQRGHIRYGQAKYDAAVADYSQALAKKTPTAADYTYRGNSYYGLEDYQKAVADYDASLRLDPNDVDTHAFRGSALLRLSRPAEAMADLNFTIERGGDKVGAGEYKNRGEALVELGRGDEGRPDFVKAEEIATAKLETDNYNFVYRAFARAFIGNGEGAIADADKYLSIDPKASEAFHARALGNVARQDFTKAIADFSQAISMGRKRLFIQRQRGDVYLRIGQPEQAIADYQAQLNLTPGNALAMVGLEKARQAMAAKSLALASPPQGGGAPATTGSPQVATLAALQPAAKAELGRRVALVIGNSAYAHVAALPNPKNDAAKVADTLRKIGFAEVTLVEDTDFRSLNRALQDFAGQADGADWAVIYYAGHGIEIANTNYLVPVDARLASDRDVTFEAVPLDRVMAASEGAKGMRLVILDACRNNPFLANMTRKTATRAVSRGLSRVEPDGGTLVVYAAKAGEVALDGSGGNSPFVTALTANLQKPGIEIGKLFRLVRDDVMKATDRKQEPFTYGSLPGDDFIFNPG